MKSILFSIMGLTLALAGCAVEVREPLPVRDGYTRGDVDALLAETQCKANARNLLQAQRCGVRR